LRLDLVDLDTHEKSAVRLQAGHRVAIHPRCAHRFSAEADAQVIEYYDSPYNPDDDQEYSGF
jgi:hypothetical protein